MRESAKYYVRCLKAISAYAYREHTGIKLGSVFQINGELNKTTDDIGDIQLFNILYSV